MFYHRRLLNHFSHMNEWLLKNGATAHLNMLNFQVTITANDRTQVFYPQFVLEADRTLAYSPAFSPNVNGFIGWLPYTVRQWPMATDKLLFKRHIEQHGKRTPQYWLSADAVPHDAIIKPAVGSFGLGQRGPWKNIDPSNSTQALQQPGDFYERFRIGQILKAWYWNDRPICIEIRDPLVVIGDGRASVEELVRTTYPTEGKAARKYAERKEALEALLAYQGTGWADVPVNGQAIQVDYLYGSSLYPDKSGNDNQLDNLRGTPLRLELESCGPMFFSTIPEAERHNTAYAVDGIIGENGEVRWLEINSNPMLPPDGYSVILDSVFKE